LRYLLYFTLNILLQQTFSYLPVKGSISLKNPDTILFYIEYYGIESNAVPEKPIELFFGRLVH
jgi:tRNA (guanine10-N2)-methyltransferase